MKAWHVEDGPLDYRVICNDGEIYAYCNTQYQANIVCSALNAQESQINRGAYPITTVEYGKDCGCRGIESCSACKDQKF